MSRLRFNAFAMNCVSHIHHGQWTRADTRQLEYTSLDPWVELAQLLERGKFDAMFLADVVGAYDTYRGGRDTSVVEGMQIPVNDPALLIPAMAPRRPSDLGFAFTSRCCRPSRSLRPPALHPRPPDERPGRLERRHLVPAERRPQPRLRRPAAHDERYDRAEEYLEVVYKLCEGSWDDDAVVARRRARRLRRPGQGPRHRPRRALLRRGRAAPLRALAAAHAGAVPGRLVRPRPRVRRPHTPRRSSSIAPQPGRARAQIGRRPRARPSATAASPATCCSSRR